MITDIMEAIDQVKRRNSLRASSGLPLLPVEAEARGAIFHDRKLAEDDLWRRFSDRVGNRIFDKALAKARKERCDPSWTPRGSWFNGDPNFFYGVARRTEKLFRRICRREIAAIEQNYARLNRGATGAP
jgi:hypothetical protein